jgi:hypothetical protein
MKKLSTIVLCCLVLMVLCSCEKKMRGTYNCTPLDAEYNSVKDVVVNIAGKISSSGCVYDRIEFKDDKNVVVYTFGNAAPATYSKNENQLFINYKDDELVFEIVDDNTLIGKDWAKGKYVKSE